MTLRKEGIAEKIARTGFTRKRSAALVETALEIVKSTLEKGEDVLISGFGKFFLKEKRERRGRNPATGEEMVLRRRRVLTFKPSSVLRDKINTADAHQGGAHDEIREVYVCDVCGQMHCICHKEAT